MGAAGAARAPRISTSSDGLAIAAHVLGGDGPALLMAHATGFCGMVLWPLARELGNAFDCTAVDLRGHGESARPPDGDFSWTGFAQDVLAVAGSLGSPGLLGMGHSSGGTALLLAERARPGTFEAMYLFEPIVFPSGGISGDHHDNPMSAAARRRRAVFASREEAYRNYASKPPLSSLRPDVLRAYVDYGMAEQPDGTVRLRCRPADEAEVFAMSISHDAFEGLSEIGCPVVVADGARSGTFPPGHAAAIAARLPRALPQTLQGAGHLAPLEDPGRLAGLIREALAPVG